MEFKDALKQAREKRKLSKWRVAKEVGVHWITYWSWEKGTRRPNSTHLIRLLRLFPELWDEVEENLKREET